MHWYHYIALTSLGVCLVASLVHIVRLFRLGKPMDYAPASGNPKSAIIYSFTGAMNPSKKESAFLHLPTYTAGVLYHLGTFLSILLFFVFLTHASLSGTIAILLSGFLIITGACGIGILVKRMITKELRSLSSPDDYISNLMVSLFQLFTVLALILPEALPEYFILASCLMLYFPMGKLKHAIYFFAARYQLGLFYGRRGVWPPKTL